MCDIIAIGPSVILGEYPQAQSSARTLVGHMRNADCYDPTRFSAHTDGVWPATLDIGMNILGVAGGSWGIAISLTYFAVDLGCNLAGALSDTEQARGASP